MQWSLFLLAQRSGPDLASVVTVKFEIQCNTVAGVVFPIYVRPQWNPYQVISDNVLELAEEAQCSDLSAV